MIDGFGNCIPLIIMTEKIRNQCPNEISKKKSSEEEEEPKSGSARYCQIFNYYPNSKPPDFFREKYF